MALDHNDRSGDFGHPRGLNGKQFAPMYRNNKGARVFLDILVVLPSQAGQVLVNQGEKH